MTPHFLIWSFGPKIGSVDRICHQTDSMNRFYLDVKTGPNTGPYEVPLSYRGDRPLLQYKIVVNDPLSLATDGDFVILCFSSLLPYFVL